eukprot:1159122-Pelagomonas_calceolata.AAC.6
MADQADGGWMRNKPAPGGGAGGAGGGAGPLTGCDADGGWARNKSAPEDGAGHLTCRWRWCRAFDMQQQGQVLDHCGPQANQAFWASKACFPRTTNRKVAMLGFLSSCGSEMQGQDYRQEYTKLLIPFCQNNDALGFQPLCAKARGATLQLVRSFPSIKQRRLAAVHAQYQCISLSAGGPMKAYHTDMPSNLFAAMCFHVFIKQNKLSPTPHTLRSYV